MFKPIATEKAPAAIGPYSQGTTVDNLVFSSGQIPVNPLTKSMPEGIADQARQSLNNVKAVIEAGGSSMSKVFKVNVFLADMGDFAAVNEVYKEFFSAPYPARSCVAVAALPLGARVEIEAIAVTYCPCLPSAAAPEAALVLTTRARESGPSSFPRVRT